MSWISKIRNPQIRDETVRRLEDRCRELYERCQSLEQNARSDAADKISAMERRIADLEATLKRVLREARGDGREATTPEFQMTMRTAQAILDDKLKI